MNRFRTLVRKHSVIIGLALMFLLTWPIDLAGGGYVPWKVPETVGLLVGYGFVIAALVMSALTLGADGVKALLKRFLIGRVGWRWYLTAFFLYPALMTAAVYLDTLRSGIAPDFSRVWAYQIFGEGASPMVFVPVFFLFDALTNGEEIGWRGYLLPRVQAKHGALAASLIIGLLWGFWHLPKYLGAENFAMFPWLMLKTAADAVLFTWVYNSTRGSLLLVTIMHASANTAGVFLPLGNTPGGAQLEPYVMLTGLVYLTALVVVRVFGAARLSREPKQVISQEG